MTDNMQFAPGVPWIRRSIARILKANGSVSGAGFLIDAGRICTCAHVVLDALGLSRRTRDVPKQPVRLDLPFVESTSLEATVISWIPFESDFSGDIAILELRHSPAADLLPVRFAADDDFFDSRVCVYGFPSGVNTGVWAYGKLADDTSQGLRQIVGDDEGYPIEPGFSGAPVWDLGSRAVVGMVTARERDRTIRVAFMLPVAAIRPAYPELQMLSTAVPFAELTTGIERAISPAGIEQFLLEYLGTPARPVVFGGRDAVFHNLDSWLDSDSSFGAVFAPAGRGKSALLARWSDYLIASKRAVVIFVPVSLRFRTSSRNIVLGIFGARLRAVLGVRADLPSDAAGWLLEIDRLLREHRGPGEPRLVVILDGIDEAVAWDPTEEIRLPPQLGRGVKVLVSARLLANRGEAEWLEALGLEGRARTFPLPPLDREGIRAVLCATGAPSFALQHDATVDELLRLTEGDPLLLKLYVDDLRARGIEADDLPAEAPGLIGFLDRWWREQRAQWGTDSLGRESRVHSMLNLLSCANAPLSAADIAALTVGQEALEVPDVEFALALMARLVIGDGSRTPYVFSHSRLSSYFFDLLSRDVDALRSFESRYVAYGSRVARALREGTLRPEQASPYVLEQYSAHLDRANATLCQFAEILELSWMRAREAREGTLQGFVKDVKTLLDRTRRLEAAKLDAETIGIQVRGVMTISSIESLARAFPPSFVRALVAAQLWSPEQAFAYARQAASTGLTSCTLGAVAGLLPPRLLVDGANLIHGEDEGWYRSHAVNDLLPVLLDANYLELAVRALTDFDLATPDTWIEQGEACLLLADHLRAAGDATNALAVLDYIRNPWSKAVALPMLAPRFEPAEQRKAVEMARRMEDNRGLALLSLVVAVDEEVGRPLFDEALAAFATDQHDLENLLSILPEQSWLTREDLLAAISARGLSADQQKLLHREKTFRDAAHGRVDRALEVCSGTHLLFNHDFLSLLDHCTGTARERVLQAAIDASPSTASDLLILAALVDEPASVNFFERGLEALRAEVRSARDGLEKYRCIETLLKYFPGRLETPGRANAIARALAARGLARRENRTDLLAVLAQRFPVGLGATILTLLKEVAGVGDSYDARRDFGCVVGMLGPYLREHEHESALQMSLTFESQPSWLWDVLHDQNHGREAAISGLAPYLSSRLLHLALAALRDVPVTTDEMYEVCAIIANACTKGSSEAWQILSRLETPLKARTLQLLNGPLQPSQSGMAIANFDDVTPVERLGVIAHLLEIVDLERISPAALSTLEASIRDMTRGDERTAALMVVAVRGERSSLWADVRAAVVEDSLDYGVRAAVRAVAAHLPYQIVSVLLDRLDTIDDLAARIELRALLFDHETLSAAERRTQGKRLLEDAGRVTADDFGQRLAIESTITRFVESGESKWATSVGGALPPAARKALLDDRASRDSKVKPAVRQKHALPDDEQLWTIANDYSRRDELEPLLEQVAQMSRAGEVLKFFRAHVTNYAEVRAVGAACKVLAPFMTRADVSMGLELVDLFHHSHGSFFWPAEPIRATLARVAELEGFDAVRGEIARLPEWERVKAYGAMLQCIADAEVLDLVDEILAYRYDSGYAVPLVDGLNVFTPRLCALPYRERVEAWHRMTSSLLRQRRSIAISAITTVIPMLIAMAGEAAPLRVAEQILDVLPWFTRAESMARSGAVKHDGG